MASRTNRTSAAQAAPFAARWTYDAAPVPLPGVAGRAVPRRFSTVIVDPGRDLEVTVSVAVSDRPRVTALHVFAMDERGVVARNLSRLPVARYLDLALASVVQPVTSTGPGTYMIQAPSVLSTAERSGAAEEHKAARRRSERQRVTPQRLAHIAELYREAIEAKEATGRYIAEREHVGVGSARQLVHQARRAGHLGKTTERRAGEEE